MANFKVGDKVVVIACLAKEMITPKINSEIVIIKSTCDTYKGNFDIEGYEYNVFGKGQSFHYSHLRKGDAQFAEDICSQLIEEFKSETVFN